MVVTSKPNQKSQELTIIFHHTKKTLPIFSDKDMTYESVKFVLNILAGYEPNRESLLLSINDSKDVTASLISATATVQDP